VCACILHIGGSFRDYRLQIHSLFPIQHETILDVYKRTQVLAKDILDPEVKERIMQFRAWCKIKLPPLSLALQRLPPPREARLPPSVRIGDATVIPSEYDEPQYDVDPDPAVPAVGTFDGMDNDDDDDVIFDSSQFDYSIPSQANLAQGDHEYLYDSPIHNPMKYRAFQY
jgi:hypothetical protein